MRTCFICAFIIFVFISFGYSQEKIDVVYLKNGDVRKGMIIENAPNDYIKIETMDGSIFTIKYADIQKMTKEVKLVTQTASGTHEVMKGLMTRTSDFGVTAGLWLGGGVSFGDLYGGIWRDKSAGFLLRAFYDASVAERLMVGAYVNFSPVSSEASSSGATMIEIGGSIKPRFPIADGAAVIKPGLDMGYRMYSSDAPIFDKVDAFGLNISVEVQFDTKNIFVPFFEIGFLAQPAGGNEITAITFPPIVYFGAGVAF